MSSESDAATDADGRPLWTPTSLSHDAAAHLSSCRADSAFMWQSRGAPQMEYHDSLRRAHLLIEQRDAKIGFLTKVSEDGLFGADVTLTTDGTTMLSRDLLDSVNEMCFLEEMLQIGKWEAETVLDVGSGYGRWAHRAALALPMLRILSADAIPSSAAIASAYLSYRGLSAAAGDVLLLRDRDAFDLGPHVAKAPRLALAVHSLPEMSPRARSWWLHGLHQLGVPWLFVVTNAPALHGRDASLLAHADDGTLLFPELPELPQGGFTLRYACSKYHWGLSQASSRQEGRALPYAESTYVLLERVDRLPRALALPPLRALVLVINLERRSDRREWMERSALAPLREIGVDVRLVPAVDGGEAAMKRAAEAAPRTLRWQLESDGLTALHARWESLELAAVQADELRLYHGRPVTAPEHACMASHRKSWQLGADHGVDFALILEDDVTPFSHAWPRSEREYRREWARVWQRLVRQVEWLASRCHLWDLLYVGRNPLGADQAAVGSLLVETGYCATAHAYAVSCRGLNRLLALPPSAHVLPVDELLPALFADHPRADVVELVEHAVESANIAAGTAGAEQWQRLTALGFRAPLVHQLESVATGAPDEVLLADAAEGDASAAAGWSARALSATATELCRSDLRPASSTQSSGRPMMCSHLRGGRPAAAWASIGIFEGDWPRADLPSHHRWLLMLTRKNHPASPDVPASKPSGRRVAAGGPAAPWCLLPHWAWCWIVALGGGSALCALRLANGRLRGLLDDAACWRCFLLRVLHADALDEARNALACDVVPSVQFAHSWRTTCMRAFGAAAAAPSLVHSMSGRHRHHGAHHGAPAVGHLASHLPQIRRAAATDVPVSHLARKGRAAEPLLLGHTIEALWHSGEPERWGLSGLLEQYAQRGFPLVDQGAARGPSHVRMRLVDYAAYMRTFHEAVEVGEIGEIGEMGSGGWGAEEPLYLFDGAAPDELWDDFRGLEHFEAHDLLDEATEWLRARTGTHSAQPNEATDDLLDVRRWLVVGPRGSGSRWHVDPFGTSAWNLCVSGRRLWCLMPPDTRFPPEVADAAEPDDLSAARYGRSINAPPAAAWFAAHCSSTAAHAEMLWAEQLAGDVVYVPRGWWHCTLNLETSVALTQNLVLRADGASAYRQLAEALGQARTHEALKAVLHQRHCEQDS